jgi:hypothetical protein
MRLLVCVLLNQNKKNIQIFVDFLKWREKKKNMCRFAIRLSARRLDILKNDRWVIRFILIAELTKFVFGFCCLAMLQQQKLIFWFKFLQINLLIKLSLFFWYGELLASKLWFWRGIRVKWWFISRKRLEGRRFFAGFFVDFLEVLEGFLRSFGGFLWGFLFFQALSVFFLMTLRLR